MADTKLTGLSAFTPALGDQIYGVDDPAGTPVSGKFSLQALMDLFEAEMSVPASVTAEGYITDSVSYTGTDPIYPSNLYTRTTTYGGTGASTSVVVGDGSSVQYTRTGNLSSPGHLLGLLGRIQVQSGQSVGNAWAVEGRVDPEAASSSVTEAVAFKVIGGTDSENAGTITGLYGMHFPDMSDGQYTRIVNKAVIRGDDPEAPIYQAGRVLGAYNTAAGYTTGGELAPAMMCGTPSGGFMITPGAYDFTAGGSPIVANIIYATPIFVPKRTTIDGIAACVTTGSAGAARLGLYFEENGIPTDLVIDAGTIDTTSISDNLVATISDTTIEAGWYFATWVSNSTPNVRVATSLMIPSLMGQTNMTGGSRGILYGAHTYGALPATFPSVTAVSTNAPIHLGLRVA